MNVPRQRLPTDHVRRRRALALAVLATTQLMFVLDGAVLNIALPSIQTALQMTEGDLAWIVNGYVVAFGGLLLLGGRTGDLLGLRRAFGLGVAIFTLASLIGGFAADGGLLIAARVLQGVGAAITSPTALALIASTFPAGRSRTRALAVFSAATGAGTAVGLIAGGLLTEFFSWRGVMFVNVPIGLIVLLVTPRLLNEVPRGHPRVDVLSAVLGSFGLGGVVYGVSRAGEGQHGWTDPVTTGVLLSAVAVLLVFMRRQARAVHPLLPLGLLKDRHRAGAYLVILLVGASLALTYFLSLEVQYVLGYDPLRAGLAFLPFAVGLAGGSWIAARLVPHLPVRLVTGTGLALAAVGVLGYRGFSADSAYVDDLLAPMLVWSTGMGMTFVPMTVAMLVGVRGQDAGIASAVMGTGQQVGGAVGLTALVAISTAAQDHRMPGATQVLAQARRDGDPSVVGRALDAVVHGYSAAYGASLVLLLAAALVCLSMVAVPRSATSGRVRE